jgi:hypothetical protein
MHQSKIIIVVNLRKRNEKAFQRCRNAGMMNWVIFTIN